MEETTMATTALNQQFLRLQGKDIPYRRGSVQVEQCDLDAANPRIQFLIGQKGETISQEELDGLIWEKDQVKALANSIFQNGGVYDPIIVQYDRKKDKYRVREGNCRTVASKHLVEQHPGDARFMTMPAMIFDVDLTEEDLAVLLADMHVAGKIRWDAYEQAKHVYDLYTIYGKTYDWLSDHLRLSKSKITELLSAFSATNEFLQLFPTPGNVKKFSLFHEIMKKKQLRENFKESAEFKQRVHKWISDGRITDSKQIRDLPLIIESDEATSVLEDEGFEEAQKVLVRNDPSLASDLFLSIKNATQKLKKAPADDLQDLKAGDPQKLILLRNLHRAIEDLATLTGVKL
jgi:hypothetical protein